jgi:hypothetical protein
MKRISIRNLPPNATMAHIVSELGIFPSVTQARKNGWDKPIVLGKHVLTKNKIHVEIVDEDLEVKERDIAWDKEPGFWPNLFNEPDPMSKAIQMPLFKTETINGQEVLTNSFWVSGILNAHREMGKRKSETIKEN